MYKTCHTEESSLRQRTLEAALLQEMQTLPYGKITLTSLCHRLQIPRKTFYRYFPTKDDCLLALIDHTLSDCNTIALTGWNGDGHLQLQNLERFFTYWHQQKPFLDALRDNDLRYLLLDRTSAIVDTMKDPDRGVSFAQDQVAYFIAHGLMSSVLRWHHHGFPCTPTEMAHAFASLLCHPEVDITRLIL